MRSTQLVLLVGVFLLTIVAYRITLRTPPAVPAHPVKHVTSVSTSTISTNTQQQPVSAPVPLTLAVTSPPPTPSSSPLSSLVPAPPAVSQSNDTTYGRVAVCLAGNARTFTRPYVHGNIMRHVVSALRNAGYLTDVFVNIKPRDNPLQNGRGETNADRAVLHTILSLLIKPVAVNEPGHDDNMIPKYATMAEDESNLFNKPSFCNDSRYYGVIGRPQILFRFHQCAQLIEQYERNHGLHYDYLYMLRPDIWINGTIYMPDLLRKRNNTVFTNMSPRIVTESFRYWYSVAFPDVDIEKTIPYSGDFLMAGARDIMDLALKAHRSVDTCDPYQFMGHLGPEMTLLRWMLKHNKLVDSEPIPICIARATGPECFLFRTFSKISQAKADEMYQQCKDMQFEFGRQREQLGTFT